LLKYDNYFRLSFPLSLTNIHVVLDIDKEKLYLVSRQRPFFVMDSPTDLGYDFTPELPVPISRVAGRYLLFDVRVASYLRREHRICGTTIGTLPLSPSQNLFLGVPVEIMPEEARLLVEKGIGLVVDDARAHDRLSHRGAAAAAEDRARRADYLARLQRQARQIEQARTQEKERSRKRALEKRAKAAAGTQSSAQPADDPPNGEGEESAKQASPETGTADETALSRSDSRITITTNNTATSSDYQVTPATSEYLLPGRPSTPEPAVNICVPRSYPLYKHLHDKGFFMTPGLRFGCQYTVYPGDPLRFHSHFLAVGCGWDEEIDLMEIVGGGRLGTGVKKGFLLGGASPRGGGDVRTFSVEWAAM